MVAFLKVFTEAANVRMAAFLSDVHERIHLAREGYVVGELFRQLLESHLFARGPICRRIDRSKGPFPDGPEPVDSIPTSQRCEGRGLVHLSGCVSPTEAAEALEQSLCDGERVDAGLVRSGQLSLLFGLLLQQLLPVIH